jgi:molybdate transport system substrate-binding protein
VGVAVAAALTLAACSGSDETRTRLSVYAASSLTEAFAEMETAFEAAHPDVDVVVTLAGSQVLRIQIEEGAPADVFASANPEHVDALVHAGLASQRQVFARNRLVVIVPLDNPAGIESFSDLPDARRIVLGTTQVPVGRYAREIIAAADGLVRPGFGAAVLANVVSGESNVRLARAKVELGEADASVVYLTDAVPSERVRTIAIPDEINVTADYVVGLVEREGRSASAEAWVAALLAPAGQAVLGRHGFVIE